MTPTSGEIALMLLSFVIFGLVVTAVCIFFVNNIIRNFSQRNARDIIVPSLVWIAMVALALFVLSGTKGSLSHGLEWLAQLRYEWIFAIGVAVTAICLAFAKYSSFKITFSNKEHSAEQ